MQTITIQVDAEVAQAYQEADPSQPGYGYKQNELTLDRCLPQ